MLKPMKMISATAVVVFMLPLEHCSAQGQNADGYKSAYFSANHT
jgi:hypothetical protein